MKFYIIYTLSISWFALASSIFAQQNSESASVQKNRQAAAASLVDTPVGTTRNVDPGAADSTVVYEAEFFNQFNPITACRWLW